MPTYTEKIVDFVLNNNHTDIPAEALAEARRATFDCIGVTPAGAKDPAGQIPADWVRSGSGGAGLSTFWGHGFKTAPDHAAQEAVTVSASVGASCDRSTMPDSPGPGAPVSPGASEGPAQAARRTRSNPQAWAPGRGRTAGREDAGF